MGDDGESDEAETGDDPHRRPPGANGPDKTVPRVDLALQELSVSVTGRSEDDLDDVQESARDLMEYLVEEADELGEDHDEYGLS